MTALVVLLVLYGVMAAFLMLGTFAASSGEHAPCGSSRRSTVPVRVERLWWPGVEEPVPIRRRSANPVRTLTYDH